MNSKTLLEIVNYVRTNKGLLPITILDSKQRLREDLNFDSLDLAEFTARLENEFGVDVFANGIVSCIGEVQERIDRGRRE
jgi:acyl carrier protein